MLKISNAVNVQILQPPNDKSGRTAIVSVDIIMTDGRIISDVCFESPRSPFENEDTLKLAKNKIISSIKQEAEPYIKSHQQPSRNAVQDDKSGFKGGGDKSASRSQLSLIHNKAQEQGKNPEELAISRFGRRLQGLKGWETDSLIKELLTKTR